MKKTFLTIVLCVFGIGIIWSQTVQRDKVLLEIGTGTWCQYCPGASMGADDLIENGHEVAVIKNHNGDSYTTTATNARNAYYGINSFPTAYFDGGSPYPGGSNTTSLYPQYLTKYNQKIAIPSYFSIDIEGTTSGYFEFDISVSIEMVDAYSGGDIRLHCVVTESGIIESWQGQDHLNFVNRLMVPNHNGTQLDFTSGNIITQDFNFELDPSWVPENCEVVIFLQDNSDKSVLNASKKELMEFENVNDYDAFISQLTNTPQESCLGMLEPVFQLKNNGNLDLNNLTIKYQVNDGDLHTFDWTGTLAFLGSEMVILPTINFTPGNENELFIYAEDPNGNPDQYPKNDTIRHSIPGAGYTSSTVSLYLKTDSYPEETTWEILDEGENVIYSGGPYAQSGQLVLETFDLESDKCYRFTVNDSGDNGLESPGMFRLYYGSNEIILQGLGDFGSVLSTDFHSDNTTDISSIQDQSSIQIYPNPFNDYTNIDITVANTSYVVTQMYNVLGELVYENNQGIFGSGNHKITLATGDLKVGVYLLNIIINEQSHLEKVTISR